MSAVIPPGRAATAATRPVDALVQADARFPVAGTSLVRWLFHAGLIVAGLYASGPRPGPAVFVFGATIMAAAVVRRGVRTRHQEASGTEDASPVASA